MEKQTPASLEERAYHIWERAGRPHGRALDHWLQAQAEVAAEATTSPEKPKRRTRKASTTKSTAAKAKTTNGKARASRAKASSSKAEPAMAKPKKVAKPSSPARKTGTTRKRTSPNA